MATYWIASAAGVHALVEGAEARDLWTQIRGWHLAAEPGPDTQVHIAKDGLVGQVPYGALPGGWAEDGWVPGPPPEPVDLTKDSYVEKPKPATGGKKTEE